MRNQVKVSSIASQGQHKQSDNFNIMILATILTLGLGLSYFGGGLFFKELLISSCIFGALLMFNTADL